MRYLILVTAILTCASSASAAILIDDFNYASGGVDFSGMPVGGAPLRGQPAEPMVDSHILGGSRQLEFTVSANPGLATASATVEEGWGDLYIETGSEVISTTSLLWNGPTFTNIDLTNGGADAWFRLEVLSVDHALTLTLTVQDESGHSAYLTQSGLDTVEEVTYRFDQFIGNADFRHITWVRMDLSSVAALDTSLDFFGTSGPLPEPSSALIALGLMGTVGLARRARRPNA